MVVQPGLCRTWSETPKTGFLTTRLIFRLHGLHFQKNEEGKKHFSPELETLFRFKIVISDHNILSQRANATDDYFAYSVHLMHVFTKVFSKT